MSTSLRGVYAAAITPFDSAGRPDYEQFLNHIRGLAEDGCHGVLVSGTTGEGPSMTASEREELFRRSASAKDQMRLLAGTGSASIEDTIRLTRAAFDAGMDAAVILPPFFYRFPPLEGVYQFYVTVIERAVPTDGSVLLYHNPMVSDVPITRPLIDQLRDRFPDQVVGIKDSSGDWDFNQTLCQIDPEFLVFVGSDALLSANLRAGGAGGITGLANVAPERLRRVYDLYSQGEEMDDAQTALNDAKLPLSDLPRIPATKTWVKLKGITNSDEVRAPLSRLTETEVEELRRRTGY